MDANQLLSKSDEYVFSEDYILRDFGFCGACGATGPFEYRQVINDELARQWGLDSHQQKLFSGRESMACIFCGCTYRLRILATSLARQIGASPNESLMEAIERGRAENISIAEINSCGVLHEILKQIPHLRYSEFGSKANNVPHQDLQRLTYDNDTFDIILTSDTFEHVPNYNAALKEVYRVLKPAGVHLFTIPMSLDKKSVVRAWQDDSKKINRTKEASYHGAGQPDYLVFTEFGFDFIDDMERIGFDVRLNFINVKNLTEPSFILKAIKPAATNKGVSRSRANNKKVIMHGHMSQPGIKAVLKGRGINQNEVEFEPEPSMFENEPRQIKRLRWLAYKAGLTNQHVNNLEAMLESSTAERELLENELLHYKNRLQKIESSPVWRVLRRLHRMFC